MNAQAAVLSVHTFSDITAAEVTSTAARGFKAAAQNKYDHTKTSSTAWNSNPAIGQTQVRHHNNNIIIFTNAAPSFLLPVLP